MLEFFLRPGSAQTLAISQTSVASSPIADLRVRLRIVSNVDAWITIGPSTGTGTTKAVKGSGVLMPAGHPEYFKTSVGDVVSAVTDGTSPGSLNIVEVA